VTVKPFGDLPDGTEVPTVSFKNDPIVRCKECRAYICPFVRWIENGAKWICPFCGDLNNTESYYYSTIEADGYRTDHDERPEFSCGTVDFIANHEYMNRPPMPPTYIFAFDVSKPAVDSGYLALACQTIKSVIEAQLLPGMSEERAKVAFLTYDKNIQYYNLRSILKQPQMMVMTDTENVFMPTPEDLLVNLQDSYDLVINLLDNLPNYFAKATGQDSCFVAALQCANNIIKQIGGKMVFF
jgi:protein transport protein SEC24